MGEKHSAVGYLFREGAFLPAQEQQLAQERQARYDSAIREAEGDIMAGKEVINR